MDIAIKQTDRQTITAAPGAYVNTSGAPLRVRVYSDRRCHVSVGGAADTVTVETGMPICSDYPEIIQLPTNKRIHFTLATGETDGGIWFTVV